MTRTFKVYKGSDVIKEGVSPITLTALTGSTKYDLQISAVEDGRESDKVDVPSFTTLAPNVPVTGVTLSPATASIAVGETQQLTPTIAPSNATTKTVTYTSATPAVATVSATGLVTGVTAGTSEITVKTTDGSKTAKSTITVRAGA